MNDTESINDEGSNSTEQKNIPTSAPQSSTVSANKELDQTNNTGTTQEKDGLSSGATAGIVIVVLVLLGSGAAYLIHRRLKQDNQASSVSSDEEAGRLDCSSFRDNDSDVSTSKGFGDTNDLRPIKPPASPIRSVADERIIINSASITTL